MNIDDIKYELAEELIAKFPLKKRDNARLMVIDRANGVIRHDKFYNVGKYLPKNSTLVVNDSKVIAARLLAKRQKTKGEVEIFLLNKLPDGYSYEVLMRPLRRLKEGEVIYFNPRFCSKNKTCPEGRLKKSSQDFFKTAEVEPFTRMQDFVTELPKKSCFQCKNWLKGGIAAQIKDKEKKIVRFNRKNVERYLNQIGHIPLPPYIKRPDKKIDRTFYQTVYAKKNGSVASPTAGLHFTSGLLRALKRAGHKIKRVTLHINYATFKPIEEEDYTQHKMHFEKYTVSKSMFDGLLKEKAKGGKIVAVGTTSCRALETVAQNQKLSGDTNLYIYPGFNFKLTDILITNFHLPLSSLLLLVQAFGGVDLMKRAYQEAIKNKYRFFSYGDAMIIL